MLENKYGYSLIVNQLSEDDGGGWLVEVPELPGCMTDGETLEEALSSIDNAIDSWINTAKEKGRVIPKPRLRKNEDEYSGKLMIRIPKKLHKDLSNKSDEEGISLNQLISFYLTKGLYSSEEVSNNTKTNRVINTINLLSREWDLTQLKDSNRLIPFLREGDF
jgi:predicted RNase H-like HicB family nuclease